MLTLKPLKWDKRSSDNETILLYNDQNITFQCSPNMVYFEIGSRITINLQNRKRILLEGLLRFVKDELHYLLKMFLNYCFNVITIVCRYHEIERHFKNSANSAN